MIKVGITGQPGFMGTHLFNFLSLKEAVGCIPFEDNYFEDNSKLENFVRQCDTIVHLAAMNRHGDPQVIYDTNIRLVKQLISAMENTNHTPHVIMSSSTQEERDNPYGNSKREGRKLLINWAERTGGRFTGMIIPNVFGPFGRPYYNSVISTFAHQLTHNEKPRIEVDASLKLIYINELVRKFYKIITEPIVSEKHNIKHQFESTVSNLLSRMEQYNEQYAINHTLPKLDDPLEVSLFNTFRSYLDLSRFPVKYTQHSDSRGSFVETVKSAGQGQFSFSTTKPGITRGNHYHLRKVERFAVIKGEAIIRLRKVGTAEVHEFRLSGSEPSFVDMPIWYTHNITNVGKDDLYTLFWINEFFDPDDPDTFYEEV